MGIDTPLAEKVKITTTFDHRTLQMTHDIIAAYFRYKHDSRGQLPIFPNGSSYEEHLRKHWTKFYKKLIQELTDQYRDFVISSLDSVCYANTAMGNMAEVKLLYVIASHFSIVDWMRKLRA